MNKGEEGERPGQSACERERARRGTREKKARARVILYGKKRLDKEAEMFTEKKRARENRNI